MSAVLMPEPIERSTDPLDFLARAQASGASPEEIGQWLTLHERVTKTQAEKAYADDMRLCQIETPTIIKDKKGQNNKYPQFENVLAIIKPIYTAHGFSLSFGTEESILPNHYRVICDVKHTGGHSERYHGDFPADGVGPKGGASSMNPIQGIGSMYTYARRYLSVLIFNLTIAGEDTDAAREVVNDEATIAKHHAQLDEIRKVYEQAELSEDEDSRFWQWIACGTGNFNDIPPQKYGDILVNLRRKVAQRKVTK